VSSSTAYIIAIFRFRAVLELGFRVTVRVSVRLRCLLANKVSVRCVYRSGE